MGNGFGGGKDIGPNVEIKKVHVESIVRSSVVNPFLVIPIILSFSTTGVRPALITTST
jgi:hypothetical protein